MLGEVVSTATDVSVIVLSLEAFILLFIWLYLLFQVTRLLARLTQRIIPAMRTLQAKFLAIMRIICSIMALLQAPFIWLSSTCAGMRAVLRKR